jgi:CheY-like chemotaxis protein
MNVRGAGRRALPGDIMDNAILVADDNDDDVMGILMALRNAGVKNPVQTVSDGDLALAYLRGHGAFANRERFPLPGILLLDLKMPRLGGFAVMEWLQTQPQFKKLLIIVLSGHNQLREVQQAYKLGAHSFLIKPCTADDIGNLMRWFAEHWEVDMDGVPRRRRA